MLTLRCEMNTFVLAMYMLVVLRRCFTWAELYTCRMSFPPNSTSLDCWQCSKKSTLKVIWLDGRPIHNMSASLSFAEIYKFHWHGQIKEANWEHSRLKISYTTWYLNSFITSNERGLQSFKHYIQNTLSEDWLVQRNKLKKWATAQYRAVQHL